MRGPGGLSEDNDDDPAARGGRDSRIRFTAPAAGEVEIGATSYEPGETGAYQLTLTAAGAEAARPDRAGPAGAIALGRHGGGGPLSQDRRRARSPGRPGQGVSAARSPDRWVSGPAYPPPSARIRATAACIRDVSTARAARSLSSAAVCAVTTSRKSLAPSS